MVLSLLASGGPNAAPPFFMFSKTTTKIETNNKLTITFYIYY